MFCRIDGTIFFVQLEKTVGLSRTRTYYFFEVVSLWRDCPARFNRVRMWYQLIGIPSRMSRWTLLWTFIQSPAVKEHRPVERHIKVSSHHLAIFRPRALELFNFFMTTVSETRNQWKLSLFGECTKYSIRTKRGKWSQNMITEMMI